jgi:hypothetical protein
MTMRDLQNAIRFVLTVGAFAVALVAPFRADANLGKRVIYAVTGQVLSNYWQLGVGTVLYTFYPTFDAASNFGREQTWQFEMRVNGQTEGNPVRISSVLSTLYADVSPRNNLNWNYAVQSKSMLQNYDECILGPPGDCWFQEWDFIFVPQTGALQNFHYQIRNRGTGKCLAAENFGGPYAPNYVRQHDCDDKDVLQLWAVLKVDTNYEWANGAFPQFH